VSPEVIKKEVGRPSGIIGEDGGGRRIREGGDGF
jgi:hypothetical protein